MPRCDEPWVQEEDNDEIAVDALSFQPRFLVQELITHRPVSAPVAALWEFSLQNRLALRERHCPTRTDRSAALTCCSTGPCTSGGALFGVPVPAGLHVRRPIDQRVRTYGLVWRAPVSVAFEQPFVSNQPPVHNLVPQLGGSDGMEKERKLDSRCIVSLRFRLSSRGRQRTGSRPGTVPTRRRFLRGRHAIFTALSPAGDCLRAQPVRRCSSQSAAPSGECSVQSRLALSTRNCINGMRAPSHSCFLPSIPGAARRTAQLRGAPLGASVPAPVLKEGFSWQPDQVPWYGSSGRADCLCSGQTDSIYDSEPDL